MTAIVDLIPKRELINPHFDHYQLCLDNVPVYEQCLDKCIDVAKPPETSFSSHHAKLFSLHNHLISDPWNTSIVYFCDKEWSIGKVSTLKAGKPDLTNSFFKLPDAPNLRLKPGRFNVSLAFPAANLCVVVNGIDSFSLLETGDRKSHGQWKTVFSEQFSASGEAHQLVDAAHRHDGENQVVDILAARVEEVEGDTKDRHGSPFITVLSWVTCSSVDGKTWSIERTRRLELSRPFEHACLDRLSSCVYVASACLPIITEDSVKPVNQSEPWEMVDGPEPFQPLYTWQQTTSELTVQLTVPQGLTKANLSVAIQPDRLEVCVKNGLEMIHGDLHARVKVDESTWTLDGQRLELSLQKLEEGMWSTVVIGDSRGELVVTEEEIAAVHDRLQHLTSEDWNANPNRADKPFNSEQLEDCDAVDQDGVIISRLDGDTHQITHKVICNSQFLFSVALDPDSPPALCLRHDVDAFLWQVGEEVKASTCPWAHVGVLNAFGYVLASKQQRRFSTCSPDMSVAVVADAQRHVYLYRQKVSVLSPLRNRKTGQTVSSVAKQQVLSLDCSPNTITGLHVTNTQIFVATEHKVLVYILKADEQ